MSDRGYLVSHVPCRAVSRDLCPMSDRGYLVSYVPCRGCATISAFTDLSVNFGLRVQRQIAFLSTFGVN
eukprot:850077-Rhodomonas_salina.1